MIDTRKPASRSEQGFDADGDERVVVGDGQANREFSAVWLFGGGKLAVSYLTVHDTLRSATAVAYFILENVTRCLAAGRPRLAHRRDRDYVSASRLKASNLVVNALCDEGIRVTGKPYSSSRR